MENFVTLAISEHYRNSLFFKELKLRAGLACFFLVMQHMKRIIWNLILWLATILPVISFPDTIEASSSSSKFFETKVHADTLLKSGHIEAAIPLYEKAIEGNPKFANAYYNLATAYYLRGQVLKAVENLEIFVTLKPRDSEALYNLACLKLKLGNWGDAEEYFFAALDCSSSPFFCQKIKEALQFMKDLRRENPETEKLIAALLSL